MNKNPHEEALAGLLEEFKIQNWPLPDDLERLLAQEAPLGVKQDALGAELQFLRGDILGAIASIPQLPEWQQFAFSTLFRWATHLGYNLRTQEADLCYEAAFGIIPIENAHVSEKMIYAKHLAELHKWTKALALLQSIQSALEPEAPLLKALLYKDMGQVLNEAGDFEGTLEAFQHCLRLCEATTDKRGMGIKKLALAGLGDAYRRQGYKDEALHYFSLAYGISEDPHISLFINSLRQEKEAH